MSIEIHREFLLGRLLFSCPSFYIGPHVWSPVFIQICKFFQMKLAVFFVSGVINLGLSEDEHTDASNSTSEPVCIKKYDTSSL